MNLEAAYPRQSARRGADFGRVVREGRQVVSVQRDCIGELAPRDLHAVAGVSAKAEYGFINDFALVCADDWVRNRSHGLEKLQFLFMSFNHPVCPTDHHLRFPKFHRGLPISKHSTRQTAV